MATRPVMAFDDVGIGGIEADGGGMAVLPESQQDEGEENPLVENHVELYALKLVQDAYEYAGSINNDAYDEMERAHNLLEGKVDRKGNFDGVADVYPNVTHDAIDSLLPQLMALLFPTDDFFEAAPQTEDFEAQAKLNTLLLKNNHEDMGFRSKASKVLGYALKYGTAIIHPFWNMRTELIRKKVSEDASDTELVETIVDDRPDFMVINPRDWFFGDVKKSDIQQMDFAGRRFRSTMRELEGHEMRIVEGQTYGYYANLRKLKNANPIGTNEYSTAEGNTSNNSEQIRDKTLGQEVSCAEFCFQPGIFDPQDGENGITFANLEEFFLKWNVKPEDLKGGWIITMGEKKIPIRIQPNPYLRQKLPFLRIVFIERDEDAWGKGVPILIESEQLEIAAKRNQALDAVTRAIYPPIFAAKGAIEKEGPKKFKLGRQTLYEVDVDEFLNVGGLEGIVKAFDIGANPSTAFSAASELEVGVQRHTGASDTFQGIQDKVSQTATAFQGISQGAASRIQFRAGNIEESFVKPWLQAEYQLYQQFFTRDKAIRVVGATGTQWRMITSKDVAADVRFNPVGARTVMNQMAFNQQVIQMLSIPALTGMPQANGQPVLKSAQIVKDFFAGAGRYNTAKYVNDPEEIPEFISIEDQHKLFGEGHSSEPDVRQPLEDAIIEFQAHIQYMQILDGQPGVENPYEREMLIEHITKTQYLIKMAIQKMQEAAMAQMQAAQPGGEGGAKPNPGQTAQQGAIQPETLTGPSSPSPGGLGRTT